jgi:hypothetical protein
MGYDAGRMGEKKCILIFIMKPYGCSYHFGDLTQGEGNIKKDITTYDRDWIFLVQTGSNCGPLGIR